MKTKKLLALAMTVCMVIAMSATAFAGEITSSGGSGQAALNLTTTNGGIGGGGSGEVTSTKLSVIVPTTLPMAMSDSGDVVTATDAKIINNSYGAVRVKTVTITAATGWKLTTFGDKSTLAKEKVDSNKVGFAVRIGNGAQARTLSESASQILIASPVAGCYLSGVGDSRSNSAKVDYAAIVTPMSHAVVNTTVATIIFVVEWDT